METIKHQPALADLNFFPTMSEDFSLSELTVRMSKSMLDQFYQTDKVPGLRLGQRVYSFFKMHQIKHELGKQWADKLYNASDEEAKKMIEAATDYAN